MATSTPWGPSQQTERIARGIVQYSTASHGGIHLSPTLNAQVHEVWRDPKGWYEEDCEASIVFLTFPQHFPADLVACADRSARHWMAQQYAVAMGRVTTEMIAVGVCPSDGHKVDRYKVTGFPGSAETSCRNRTDNGLCDEIVQLHDQELLHRPDGSTTVVVDANAIPPVVQDIRRVLLDGAHYTDAAQIELITRILARHGHWTSDEMDAYARRRTVFTVAEHPDLLAFDGSNEPQKRRLTARDRDVVVRILARAHNDAVRAQPIASGSVLGGLVAWTSDDLAQLAELMFVLDPRP